MRRFDVLMAAVPLSHRRTGLGVVNERGKLVGVQAHAPYKADDVQIFQLGALLCQFLLPRLQLGDLGGVFLIFRVDFRVHEIPSF